MEQSITALAFKGSIAEAILESKRQKKLFVVYISGEDEVSAHMEATTWVDTKVVESLPKYCILLHIPQGSTKAVQFSAFYPQNSVPCVTVVGYNGIQVCQNEGYVTAEVLLSSIEKAWLSLHLQETLLNAALASKKSEPSSSGTSENAHQEIVGTPEARPTADTVDLDKETTTALPNGALASNSSETSSSGTSENGHQENVCTPKARPTADALHLDEESSSKIEMENFIDPVDTTQLDNNANTLVSSSLEIVEEPPTFGDNRISSNVEKRYSPKEGLKDVVENHSSKDSKGLSSIVSRDLSGDEPTVDTNMTGDQKAAVPVSDEICLNIKLPNGTSLQQTFTKTSSLCVVKAYVGENQEQSVVAYNLAIPYPRKVFVDQDLSKSLSELGLSNRQALILVPRQNASGDGTTATTDATSSASDEGYFAFAWRILSYVNPLAYISGRFRSLNSDMGPQSTRQYGPNPGLGDNLRGASSGPSTSHGENKLECSSSNKKSRQPANTRFGSNVHTLKHDEDDAQFGKRNPFWNGNSTQYNGSGDNDDNK